MFAWMRNILLDWDSCVKGGANMETGVVSLGVEPFFLSWQNAVQYVRS